MQLDSFVFSAMLLLAVASLSVALFKRLGLGSVLGLLVAGIAVGPHSPGPYVTTQVEDVRHFTELGVVMLLFLIGLEMKPQRLWAMRREVFGLGSLQVLLSGLAIGLYAMLFLENRGVALLIGLTLALSSTAFVMQILEERGEVASPHGRTTFAVLLMQDLAIVPLLALVPLLATSSPAPEAGSLGGQALLVAGMLGLVWGLGRYVLPTALERMARQGNREGFFLVVMLAVFTSAWATHMAGLSMALGAFLMGLLLSSTRYNYQIEALVEPYKGLLMSLFFVAVGMSIDIAALAQAPLLFALHVSAIIAIKLGVLLGLLLLFGFERPLAVKVAFLLVQGGEFGFVLFGAAHALGVIDNATFALSVGVISTSMLLTPLLVKLGDRLSASLARRVPVSEGPYRFSEGMEGEARVVIAGYGRVGHTVATLLQGSSVPYIAFDNNTAHVAEGQADGRPVYYGDISDPKLMARAHLERVVAVVLTIDRPQAMLKAVTLLRSSYPHLKIIARARDLMAVSALLEAGATGAYPEALEASLRLGAEVLEAIGVADESVDLLLHGVRRQNYALVREE